MKKFYAILVIMLMVTGSTPVKPKGTAKLPDELLKSDLSVSAEQLNIVTQKLTAAADKLENIKP
ncbi:hypothetical protein [Pedobacter antarcticus]|uniref:hypothetical protein n=1 Tax=Pedobacter antarcticus TaxID=34086 RepID=UPI002931F196|nr:hypothetical protein [Pedobacter antarcticus]